MVTSQGENLSESELASVIPTAIYLHIPFCHRRCHYCDFPVSIVGDKLTPGTYHSIEQYVDKLCQEILSFAPNSVITPNPTDSNALKTVFFGGGTPSLLSAEQLERILHTVRQTLGIAPEAEISLEFDPGTFDLEKVQGYREVGINRVSLGVQAFQDKLLKTAGRFHCSSDIFKAVDLLYQGGITNLSLDLISGLPYQSLEEWQYSLEKAIALAPHHLSCYDLVLEPVTAFGKQYQPGVKPLPDDETTAQMYRLGQQILTSAGYEHYEISNYAQPGYQCRHNQVYWHNQAYYGCGMGAASYTNRRRFTRPRTRKEYYQWVDEGCQIAVSPTPIEEVLLETLMLGLRLAKGVDLSYLKKQFGAEILTNIRSCLSPYLAQGLVEVISLEENLVNLSSQDRLPEEGYLRLNDPDGFLFSNTILATLFEKL